MIPHPFILCSKISGVLQVLYYDNQGGPGVPISKIHINMIINHIIWKNHHRDDRFFYRNVI